MDTIYQEILYFKGKPESILPLLLTIRKYQFEKSSNLKDEIEKQLIKITYGDSTSAVRNDNLIWSRIRPPLITLDLIENQKKIYKLTAKGKAVIKHIKDEDYDFKRKYLKIPNLLEIFKRKIGKILVDIDHEKSKILETLQILQKSQMEFVNLVDLMIELKKKGINPCQRIEKKTINENEYKKITDSGLLERKFNQGSRLSETLRYYDYFNLVVYRKYQVSVNKVKISSLQNEKILRDSRDVTTDEFFEALLRSYNKKVKGHLGPYVPIIPDIQKLVIYDLEITSDVFKEKLIKFPVTFKGKNILLAPSRTSKQEELLIKKGRIYFYYISIFEGGKE